MGPVCSLHGCSDQVGVGEMERGQGGRTALGVSPPPFQVLGASVAGSWPLVLPQDDCLPQILLLQELCLHLLTVPLRLLLRLHSSGEKVVLFGWVTGLYMCGSNSGLFQ